MGMLAQLRVLRLCLVVAVMMIAGKVLAINPPSGPWRHKVGQGHPLVGKVWDVGKDTWIDHDALLRRLETTRYILLGEKHDNADHHRLQAWVVTSLAATGRRPAVAFEMLDVDDQAILDRQLERAPTDAVGLGSAVRWREKGWPEWSLYQPIFEAALTQRLPILATNLSRFTTRTLAQQGSSVLNPEFVRDYGLDRPLAPGIHRWLSKELKASHCGHASPKTIDKMILVQRARDAQMAQQLTRVRSKDGAVLMAGAFHVRKDGGVPVHLAKVTGQGSVASLAFVEVADDAADPVDYQERFGTDKLPFDYVWFTPRVDDDDPCEKFAEQLKRMKKP